MCLGPEVLAAAALSGAGAAVNQRQQNKNQQAKINAKNEAAQQEVTRQQQYEAANQAQVQKAVGQYQPQNVQQTLGDIITSRQNTIQGNTPDSSTQFGSVPDSAPQVVKSDMAKRMGDAVAKGKAGAVALAKLGSVGDLFAQNQIGNQSASNNIQLENNLSRGSLGINQQEQQEAANNAGNKQSFLGDGLQVAGTALGLYGAINGPGSVFGANTGTGAPISETVQGPSWNFDKYGKIKNLAHGIW